MVLDVPVIVTAVTTLLGGGVVGSVVTAIIKKPTDTVAAEAAFQTALNGATQAYTEATKHLIEAQDSRIRSLGDELHESERKNGESREQVHALRSKLMAVEAQHSECLRQNTELTSRVARLEARVDPDER